MPVPWFALGDHLAGDGVQCRKQRGGAVAEVIVSDIFDIAQLQGQQRLGSLKRLDLAFLVHAENQGVVRRVRVQPYDVMHPLHEQRIGGQLEGPRAEGPAYIFSDY